LNLLEHKGKEMNKCQYCGREFNGESAHHDHLRAEHAEELGPIDRRRLESEDGDRSRTPVVLAGIVLMLALGVMIGAGYVLLDGGGGDNGGGSAGSSDAGAVARTPTGVGSVHYHGTIEMRVTGQSVDFSRSQYQLQADPFHFENGNGDRWHVHAEDVTLEYAMSTLGIGVTNESVTYEGETYRSGGNTNVTVAVNGEPVTPSEYVLQEGDRVRIAVQEN
jgi:sulfur carrier protein ThiS